MTVRIKITGSTDVLNARFESYQRKLNGWFEAQDLEGNWHRLTSMQAAEHASHGAPVRFVEQN